MSTSVATGGRELTPELLARYDRPGPRYTSYPTAVEFHSGVDHAEYVRRLAGANLRSDDPLSPTAAATW